jgi:hypothetical protein
MRRTALALAVPLLALSACGTSAVSSSDLEKQVDTQLTKVVGQKPDNVSCPHDLKAEKGAKTRCTLTADGTKYGVTVTATKVDGSRVEFSIKVDDKPMS